jgi:uncharacterized protein
MGGLVTKQQQQQDEPAAFVRAKEFAGRVLRERLPQDLLFHSVDHTLRDVLPACELLARKECVVGDDLLCLRTAALFHDIGYVEQYAANEPVGCAWAERHLPELGYTADQLEKIKRTILATQMPQRPTDILGRIICDADLSHLGSAEFFARTELLRREAGLHSGKEIAKQGWAQGNVKFLTEHAWWTRSAREMWDIRKSLNLQRTKDIAAGTATDC